MSIVLHIPHDSINIPTEYLPGFLLSPEQIEREIIRMTDMHTAELYDDETFVSVIFPVSRLLCDPERFDDDSREIMAERGMGVVYEVTSDLLPLRDTPSPDERQRILNAFYYPHHKRLEDAVENARTRTGRCLVVDCHSFPSRPLPYEMIDNNDLRSEICIGTDSFHTPAVVSDCLRDFFTGKGYSVSINDPFAGALVPMRYYRQDKTVSSVMYEVRRDLYMDEATGGKTNSFHKIQEDVQESIRLLSSLDF